MGPTYVHCLHEQSNQILDFEDTLGVVHFMEGFEYHTNGGLTHGVPEFVDLKFRVRQAPVEGEREASIHQPTISGLGPVS